VSFGLGAAAIGLLAALAPAAAATRRTLADAQRAASRPPRAPLWRRAGLDLLLLPPSLYGLYQIHSGALPGAGAGRDLTANPLIILIPALLSLSLGLLTLRLLPWLLERASRAATRPHWVAPLVALRALARQPGSYSGPLLLLVLTLSLAIFSAAAAATLDEALRRSAAYRVGAAAQLIETGESTEQDTDGSGVPERRNIEEEARFLFVPVGDHLEVPGVQAASRVGRYDGRLVLGGAAETAQLIGIDRLTLPEVLRGFDPAWAGGASLGELMNRLAAEPAGALVSSDVLGRGLAIGDRLTVQAELYGDRREVELVIAGAVELFPGLYPQDGPLVIVNLDYLFDQMGGQYPYDVWIDYAPDAEIEAVAAGVRRLGVDLVEVRDAAALVLAEQSRPERQGLFGLLSIGFVAAGGLTVLGFLIAISITARRRALELGVLRAIGMAGRGATASLAVEQGSIMACGLAAGGAIGVLCALLVVPTLQGGVAPYPGTPPVPPRLAWAEMGLAAALLVAAVLVALLGLALALRRRSLFSVVKLGDAN
jgi:putative ABC transport system permease protein